METKKHLVILMSSSNDFIPCRTLRYDRGMNSKTRELVATTLSKQPSLESFNKSDIIDIARRLDMEYLLVEDGMWTAPEDIDDETKKCVSYVMRSQTVAGSTLTRQEAARIVDVLVGEGLISCV